MSARLLDLDPVFLKIETPTQYRHVDSIAEADGVRFQCPVCFATNGGPVGTHHVMCWRPSVPQTIPPTPGRWELHGTGLGDLSLVAGSSSVQIVGGCKAHFFVRAGGVVLA